MCPIGEGDFYGGFFSSGLCSLKLLLLYNRHIMLLYKRSRLLIWAHRLMRRTEPLPQGGSTWKCDILTHFISPSRQHLIFRFLQFPLLDSPEVPEGHRPKSAVTWGSRNRPPPDEAAIHTAPSCLPPDKDSWSHLAETELRQPPTAYTLTRTA